MILMQATQQESYLSIDLKYNSMQGTQGESYLSTDLRYDYGAMRMLFKH